MRLSGKILKNVINVNRWEYATQAIVAEGQPNTIFVQLVDLEHSYRQEKSEAFPEFPIRYISSALVMSAEAFFSALVDDEQITITGTQAFASDKSIWKFELAANQVPKSGSLKITIVEDGISKTFLIQQAISTEVLGIGGC
jgi:hypothetical protein